MVGKLVELKDKMCACKDKACADGVSAEMTTWGSEHKAGDSAAVSEEDQKKLMAVTEQLTACLTKVVANAAGSAAMAGSGSAAMAGSGSDAGSGSAAMAGSGSDAGSAAMAGSGASAPDVAMAHRAGMCPSTVFGSTTTSATKGKTVIVTIASSDKDAIAAIQKRTDELLAEKQTAVPSAGGGHNMKGAHGGSQGLCPIHVPDGAKATAKHTASGVAVTITPKDKVDELATEINGRITKAASWVKTNVPDAPQGNQGGVGGGKGDDGSNHSGKGDGKGHERKGGGGSGGGKGTGGGGGAGTGSGKPS